MTPAAASILRVKLEAAPSFLFIFSTPRRDQTAAKGWVGGRVDEEGDVDGGDELAQKGQSPSTDRRKH